MDHNENEVLLQFDNERDAKEFLSVINKYNEIKWWKQTRSALISTNKKLRIVMVSEVIDAVPEKDYSLKL